MFALLWALETRAEYVFSRETALIPLTLFAANAIPMPVPQTKMPLSHLPCATSFATAFAIMG